MAEREIGSIVEDDVENHATEKQHCTTNFGEGRLIERDLDENGAIASIKVGVVAKKRICRLPVDGLVALEGVRKVWFMATVLAIGLLTTDFVSQRAQ